MTPLLVNSQIANMDLWTPKKDQNKYGARANKNLKTGSIGSNGYVPDGLTASQYNQIRAEEAAKKEAKYQKNKAKAFKFLDFTDFYLKRGTDEGGKWLKSAGRGHEFVKVRPAFVDQLFGYLDRAHYSHRFLCTATDQVRLVRKEERCQAFLLNKLLATLEQYRRTAQCTLFFGSTWLVRVT